MILAKPKYSTQELATFLAPGMLGLQIVNKQPYNLLFRPQQEADPRIQLLTTQSWFELKNAPGVLYAVATLEAYNELEESDLEFEATERIVKWVASLYDAKELDSFYKNIDNSPLFDYQKEAVRFLYGTKRAMLSLSPGLGKTLTSAYAAGLRAFPYVLLVCPASLLYYWKSELEKWENDLPYKPMAEVWHKETHSIPDVFGSEYRFWAITNPETLARHLDEFLVINWGLMIVDESIMYKHRDSMRSKQLKTMAQTVENVWLLTGAPATRNLDDMWHQFHILNPRGYSSYWRFARKYCVVVDDQWGSKVVANKKNAEKEIQKNYQDIYFSRSQDDVLNIPDWIFEDVDIPMLPEQDKIYNTLREELYIKIGDLDDNKEITVNNHLSLMIRSIQVASNPALVGAVDSAGKWDALPELMEVYPAPYIVWVNFIQSGLSLREKLSKLGMTVGLANGSTPMLDRQLMIDAMQAGNVDALVLNNQVGKYGFNITKARTAFFVERMYDDSYYQCLYRNRRIGTTHSPVVVNMRSVTQKGHHTIDHVVHSVLDYRTGMTQHITARMLKEVYAL